MSSHNQYVASCPQCGAPNPGVDRCISCGSKLPRAGGAPADTEPWQAKQQRLAVNELSQPPRAVPLLLKLAAFRPMFFFMVAGGALLVAKLIGILVLEPSLVQMVYAGVGGVTLLFWILLIWRGFRKGTLLKSGVAARAEVLKSKSGIGSYQNSTFTRCQSWEAVSVNYSGPSYTSKLRVWGPTGESATFKIKGLSYEDGIFLLLPHKPGVHASVCSYGVPLRPDPNGQWKVWPMAVKRLILELVLGVVLLIVVSVLFMVLS